MKIKMIDLFKKIANGEEVPKTIKYAGKYWSYFKECNQYNNGDGSNIWDRHNFRILNDEVEIIEEDRDKQRKKELEKVKETIKKNFAIGKTGIHNSEGILPFTKKLLFKGKYFKLQLNVDLHCFEVLNARKEEFNELKKYYYTLFDGDKQSKVAGLFDKYTKTIEKQPWLMPIVTIALLSGDTEYLEKMLSELDDEE